MVSSVSFSTVMLAVCRRSACRRYLHRELSTATEATSTTKNTSSDVAVQGNGILFVKPWGGIPSVAHALAMVRGIESKYGKVRSFKFVRDVDVIKNYVPYFWAELETPSNFTGEEVFQIPAPNIDLRRQGGVGLDDFQGLLSPSDVTMEQRDWQNVSEQMMDEVGSGVKQKFIEIRVESTVNEIPTSERRFKPISRNRQLLIANAFSQWGGFSSRPETDSATATPNSDSQSLSDMVQRDNENHSESLPPEVTEEEPDEPPGLSAFEYEYKNLATIKPAKLSNQVSGTDPTPQISLSQSIKEKQNQGKPLSRRERNLLQAASLVRKPLPKRMRKSQVSSSSADVEPAAATTTPTLATATDTTLTPTSTMAVKDKEWKKGQNQSPPEIPKQEGLDNKGFQEKIWKLVGGRWF